MPKRLIWNCGLSPLGGTGTLISNTKLPTRVVFESNEVACVTVV